MLFNFHLLRARNYSWRRQLRPLRTTLLVVAVTLPWSSISGGQLRSHVSVMPSLQGVQEMTSMTMYVDTVVAHPSQDTVLSTMHDRSLRYGLDTTVSPCADFFQYVHGGWRAKTDMELLGGTQLKYLSTHSYAEYHLQRRIQALLDSARSIATTTSDPMVKAIGNFYASCMTADTLERNPRRGAASVPDSSRSAQCARRSMVTFPDAVGQVFADDLFASGAAEKMDVILKQIMASIIKRIEANPILSPGDRTWAIGRLHSLKLHVGRPQAIDYRDLTLSDDYYRNKVAIAEFTHRVALKQVGNAIGSDMGMKMFVVNAQYIPTSHSVEVPAGIFMPPFFDPRAEDALNYSGVGSVIAHEIFHSIAHGFSSLDNAAWKENTDKFRASVSAIGTVDKWSTNGTRTFHEDVADLGAALVTYDAWKEAMQKSRKTVVPLVEGFTPDQRFFLGLALIWRSKWQPIALFSQDTHSSPFARVTLMMQNSPQFAKAFGCKDGDAMVLPPEKRVQIW